MKQCPKCGTEHDKPGKFCSRKCANSRSWTTEDNLKKSASAFKSIKYKPQTEIQSVCECGTTFSFPPYRTKKYCSIQCSNKFVSRPTGGYRVGSGRAKTGYYKGIYCGSTYELCWVIHSIDNDIKFIRFPGKLERDGFKYYPDFLLSDGKTIIETKGYEKQDSVDKKTMLAESFGYDVKVLRKEDLEYAFSYVKNKYNTNNFQTLYDDYKPKYSYTCNECHSVFERDKILKTTIKFCSWKCGGIFRSKINKSNNTPIKVESGNYKRTFSKEEALSIYNNQVESLQQIADRYNVNKNSIWFIKQKKSYKWIHK